MAQTTQKKRAGSKRSASSKRTRSPSAGSAKSKARGSSSSKRGSKRGSKSSSTPSALAAAENAVENTAKDAGQKVKSAGQTVGSAASKAKVPLIAGGAALAGAAGGLALANSKKHRSPIASLPIRKPRIKITSSDVARAAKEVGSFSAQVGELATELQENREAANGHKRSPVEVVLQGLTSRRRR